MIEHYDNDLKMAELGRRSARFAAIKKAREAIRDNAVLIGGSDNADEIASYKLALDLSVKELIELLLML
jgi:hypothetical protein